MKKLFTLIMAGLLAAAMIAPASAADAQEVLYGTPVIDGVLDEMYTRSASHSLRNFAFYAEGDSSVGTTAEGTTAYMLWDEDNLYIAVEVNDETPCDYDSSIDYAAWNTSDNIENFLFSVKDDTYEFIHISAVGDITYAELFEQLYDSDIETAAESTDKGYVIEFAIPLPEEIAELKAGSEFVYSLQYNDYIPASNAVIANGGQSIEQGDRYVFSDTKALVEDVIVTPVEDSVTTAPQTFDAGIIAAVTAIVSAAGYAISKKR